MLRARANEETFVSATMFLQQRVLVCQGLNARPLSHFSKHVLSSKTYSLKNTLLQRATPIRLYTLQHKVLELSGSNK